MECKAQQQQQQQQPPPALNASMRTNNSGIADRNQNGFPTANSKPFYPAQYDQQSFNAWKSGGQKFMNHKQGNYQDATNKQLASKNPEQQNFQALQGKPVRYNGMPEETSWNSNYRNAPKNNALDVRGGRYQNDANLETNNKWSSRKPNPRNKQAPFEGGMGFQKLNNFIFLVDSPDVYGKRTQNNSQSYWCKTKNNFASNTQQSLSEDKRGVKGNKNPLNRNRDIFRDNNSNNCDNSNFRRYRPFSNTNREEQDFKDSNRKPIYGNDNYRKPKEYKPFFNQTTEKNRDFNDGALKNTARGNALNNGVNASGSKIQNTPNFNNQNGRYFNNFRGGRGNQKNGYGMPRNGYAYGSNNAYTYGTDNGYYSFNENSTFVSSMYRDRNGQPRERGGQASWSCNTNYNPRYCKEGPLKMAATNKTKSSCPNFKDYGRTVTANQATVTTCKESPKAGANSRNVTNNSRSTSDYGNKSKGQEEKEKMSTSCVLETANVDTNKLSAKNDHSTTM